MFVWGGLLGLMGVVLWRKSFDVILCCWLCNNRMLSWEVDNFVQSCTRGLRLPILFSGKRD